MFDKMLGEMFVLFDHPQHGRDKNMNFDKCLVKCLMKCLISLDKA